RGEVRATDCRDVDRVRDQTARERRDHLLGCDHAGAVLSFSGRGAEMRRDDYVVESEDRVLREGLVREHVETRAGDLAGVERISQGVEVQELSPRAVDDPDRAL